MDRPGFERLLSRRATRRGVLAGGLGLPALTTGLSLRGRPTRGLAAVRPATPIATPVLGNNPFRLGVASGDPLPDAVVLWTRLAVDPLAEDGRGGMAPVAVQVAWELADDEGFSGIVRSGTAVADPALGHSVHVDATGLEPGRAYFYRFMAGREVSPIGRTKTAPAVGASAERLRFGFCSCANWEHGWFTAYRALAADDLDLIVHLGDYLYEYPSGQDYRPAGSVVVRPHPDGEPVSLAAYRQRHALYKTDPDLQAAHAAFPWVATWDDHDVENDYAGAVSENNDPVAEFLERRADAYQAYYEHMPLRPESMPQGPDMRLYRRLTFGTLAEFSVLDTRQYRTDQPCGEGLQPRCPAALDPAATMAGPEQERWLLEGLDASDATWNVVAQQVMMAQIDGDPGSGQAFLMDLWDGYPAARNRILAHVQTAGTRNAVVLTGDVHSAWVNDLKADWDAPNSATLATEFVTTSVTAANPFGPQIGLLPSFNPHVRYFDGRQGYARCVLTAARWQTDFLALDDVTDPNGTATPIASFVVEAGKPGAQQA